MAGGRRTRVVTPRSLSSFDPELVPSVRSETAPIAPMEDRPPLLPARPRLEESSIRSLEERRNRWIRNRLAREARTAAAIPAVAPPPSD
jgi:hypothetical protein